jgi:hypothetical protein
MQIRRFVPVAVVAAFVGITPQLANGEFKCSAQVSYKWVKDAPVRGGTPPAVAPTPTEPSTVHFASVERSGADEAAAKALLDVELTRQKVRASEACRREHEAYGECVARKFSAHKGTTEALSFSARKEFEKAMVEECKGQVGSCVSVSSSDPACKEVVVAAAADAAPAEGEKKDDKKKKK